MMSQIKGELAFAHQVFAHLKMDDATYTHLSHIHPERRSFFISPFGLMYAKTTPENLVHIGLDGVLQEDTGCKIFNKTGYSLHSSIYRARRDVNAVIHLHTPQTIAIGALECGLLPINQHALHFYERVSYHNYDSLVLEPKDEEAMLICDLGPINNVMFLRNHGFVTVGRTIEEAVFYAYHLQRACEAQIMTLSMNKPYISPPHEVCVKACKELLSFEKNLGRRDFESWKDLLGNK